MEREQVRTREREAEAPYPLEAGYKAREEFLERQYSGRILIPAADAPNGNTRQANTNWYLCPYKFDDTALQSWQVFINNIKIHSGRHIHQGGICLFVLDGVGYTVVEGVREEWGPGDLIMLPIKRGGVEHQHFDADPPKGARWLAWIFLPQFEHLATGIRQTANQYSWGQQTGVLVPGEEKSRYQPDRGGGDWLPDSYGEAPRTNGGFNGYAELMRMRNAERERVKGIDSVVHGDALDWELNPQGRMQWYLHPSLPDRLTRSYLFYRQEIPAGSRSGKQLYQGGKICYFVEGQGHTIIDGERYDWKADDLLQLPLRPNGVEYQHFNDNPRAPARFIACEPNTIDAQGLDRGSGWIQLENCPEYDAG